MGDIDGAFISEAENDFLAKSWRRRRRIRVLVLVAALLTALIAIGCAAASYFEVDDVLKEYLGIAADYDEELGEGVAMIGLTQTVGDFTVTIDQMFGDPHAAWIVFHVTVPERAPLRPDSEGNIYATVYGDFLSVSLDIGSQGGGYRWECVAIDDETRTKTYILGVDGTHVSLIGRKITLTFDYDWMNEVGWPTGYFHGFQDEEGKPITMEFTFSPKYRDMTKKFLVNETCDAYKVKEVRISPASTIIRIAGLPDDQHYIKGFCLTMKDGTTVEGNSSAPLKNIWWNGSIDVFIPNDQIVDPSEVKSVSFSVNGEKFYTVELD